MTLRWSVFVATAVALLPAAARADSVLGTRRIAVVVGANVAPAGRRELRFALDDAQRMADTLRRVGRFAPSDVHVLLEPSPSSRNECDSERTVLRDVPGHDETVFKSTTAT